jgi:heptosyltransferase II
MIRVRKIFKTIYLLCRGIILNGISFLSFSKKELLQTNDIKNILVIRLDRIGDMILSTPALRAIKHTFPKAKLTVCLHSYTKDLIANLDYVDDILEYKKRINLRPHCFDLVFDLIHDYTLLSAYLAFTTGAKHRVGFDIYGRGLFFTKKVSARDKSQHIIDMTLDLVKAVSKGEMDKSLDVPVLPEARGDAAKFLDQQGFNDNSRIICVHPGGVYWTKRWDYRRFAQAADEIIKKYQAIVILIGSNSEKDIIEKVKSAMSSEPILFLGQPLKTLVALIQKSNLLICNNSGPLHIASALNVPTVSTMGPAIASRWWPHGKGHIVLRKDIPCIGCGEGYCRIKTHDCMRMITVEDMLDAVSEQLKTEVST